MIRSIIKRTAIVLAAILVVLAGRGLFYYSGYYQARPAEMPGYEQVVVPEEPSTEYSDFYKEGEGTIIIDLAHDNAFDIEELNVLILRLVSRGLTIDFFDVKDDLAEKLLDKKEIVEEEPQKENKQSEEEIEEPLEEEELEKRSPASAFVVVCPLESFSGDERNTIRDFVSNGGKLLMIADPTRHNTINSLSYDYGLVFEPDYLYNMKENDANYRNIFITEFEENIITEQLHKIVLYTAGSISSADYGIAFVDEDTFSSFIETKKDLSPIAMAHESNVLAIYDFTFMIEPYNGIMDNNQLISNIADWLAD